MIGAVLLLCAPFRVAAAAGDPGAGKTRFASACAICHSVEEGTNKIGPSLYGVSGRAAGEMPGYAYSAVLKNSGKTWDNDMLSAFLAKPAQVIPGTKMMYLGLADPDTRQDVIAYLTTLKD